MKAGIITFHFPYNCGAVLQCIALQIKIEQLGHSAQVINYRPWYHQNRYTPFKNPIYFALKQARKQNDNDILLNRLFRGCKGFLRTVYSWKNYKRVKVQDQKFNTFINHNMNLTRVYRNFSRLKQDPPSCDLYIAGSDQIWNPNITESRFDPAYLLDFGDNNCIRASYAVGTNFDNIDSPIEKLQPYLRNFNFISLREAKYKDVVSAAANKPISVCLDPTFLLDAKDYENLICDKELEKEKFILTYTMPNVSQHKVYNAAKILSETLQMKVIDVSGNPSQINKKIPDNRICGPDEFLWYMKNASYVLTNSFHGTAFSIIYRKEFAAIPHTDTGNRVIELLQLFELNNRYADNGLAAVKIFNNPVDYSKAEPKIAYYRNESINFLKKCLNMI